MLRKLIATMFGIVDKFSCVKKSTIEVFCSENDSRAKLRYDNYNNSYWLEIEDDLNNVFNYFHWFL